MNAYEVGSRPIVTAKFYDPDGVLFDPDTVSAMVKGPDGIVTDIEGAAITHVSTGVYEFEVAVDAFGLYLYRVEGTGENQAAVEGALKGKESQFD